VAWGISGASLIDGLLVSKPSGAAL
jgi:hypothetical protein